ncbi:methyltransferase domain-containing protein [Colletotrichum sojae]|uniref:Methyltransferase domain-containing protein n=1 Tax=Colletotrichum sojae TaxID=2175907 RepID=A0A8H6IUT2_9PEZI|nr:methyltransferase domain-containing protein [Colletotrichum sojae]
MQHHLWALTWDGKLCQCPKNKGANRVLDVGTGTGIWAIDYGMIARTRFKVIGVDLSPIQPQDTPPNCRFEVDDVEKEWTWSQPFDFVFIRHGNACFASWEGLLKRAYDNLEPGGYIELQDNAFPILSQDGSIEGTAVARWSSLLIEAARHMGRSIEAPSSFKQMVRDAGFVDVVERREVWPIGPWTRDRQLYFRGGWVRDGSLAGLEASCLAFFTRMLGWTREEVLVFCAEVRRDLRDIRIHGYWNVYAVYGRKPLDAPGNPQPGASA